MRKGWSLLLLITWCMCLASGCQAQQGGSLLRLCTWNIANLGASKNEEEISRMAATVQSFHLVAIQEVSTGPAGAQAVAALAGHLNRSGSRWDYYVSEATSSAGYTRERYALLWQTAVVTPAGKPFLCSPLSGLVEREPLLARFRWKNRQFTVVVFHALPKAKQPESEIKYFRQLPDMYPRDSLMFMGDFNLPSAHSVFNPLKSMGYLPVSPGQKTSLRQRCLQEDCLASEYDHLFVPRQWWNLGKAGVVHFYRNYPFLEARNISDHCPVWAEIN